MRTENTQCTKHLPSDDLGIICPDLLLHRCWGNDTVCDTKTKEQHLHHGASLMNICVIEVVETVVQVMPLLHLLHLHLHHAKSCQVSFAALPARCLQIAV